MVYCVVVGCSPTIQTKKDAKIGTKYLCEYHVQKRLCVEKGTLCLGSDDTKEL